MPLARIDSTRTRDAITLLALLLKGGDTPWSLVVKHMVRKEGVRETLAADALLAEPTLTTQDRLEIAQALLAEYAARRVSTLGTESILAWHKRLERCHEELVPIFTRHGLPLWEVLVGLRGTQDLGEPWDKLGILLHLSEPVMRALLALKGTQDLREGSRQVISIFAVPGAAEGFEAQTLLQALLSPTEVMPKDLLVAEGAKKALSGFLKASA